MLSMHQVVGQIIYAGMLFLVNTDVLSDIYVGRSTQTWINGNDTINNSEMKGAQATKPKFAIASGTGTGAYNGQLCTGQI
jgi:hypothetical protein